MKKALIIGGGAAGLMAGCMLKEQNPEVQVTVMEKNDRVGKKLLSTGNGRCNLANEKADSTFYNDPFVQGVFGQFSMADLLAKLKAWGLLTTAEEGRIYPYSQSATSLHDVLRLQAEAKGVRVLTGQTAEHIVKKDKFIINGKFEADSVLLCCGSPAGLKGEGSYGLAKGLGHTITSLVPCNTPLKCQGEFLKGLSGIRTQAQLTLLADKGEVLKQEKGEILFRDYGLSGIPVFVLSTYRARKLLKDPKTDFFIGLDLLPDDSQNDVEALLKQRQKDLFTFPVTQFFTGLFVRRIAENILSQVQITEGTVGALSEKDIKNLCRAIKDTRLKVTGDLGFEGAQVTCGGVALGEVEEKSLMSRRHNGLFFAGEVLHIDGECGGYNILWALCSGAVAGKAMGEYLGHD